MDILTRGPLYEVGLNYRHGTGHGIGAYGLVHESPIQVRVYKKEEHELLPGQFFSDEPGLYFEGEFGIRLETVLRVEERKQHPNAALGFGPFLHFQPVCLVPFEPKLIDYNLLTRAQVNWLNGYNQLIREKVLPRLESGSPEESWVEARVGKVVWQGAAKPFCKPDKS
jgi:Xaa-Pro aminopeptidase